MNLSQRTIATISFLIAVLGTAIFGCSNQPRSEPKAPETVSNVPIVVAQKTTVPDWLESLGTVRAGQLTQVSSQITGNIIEIRAHEGARVQAGQVLATIDDAQPRSGVEQATAVAAAAGEEVKAAESDSALAEATLKRYQQLYERKSVSPQEFEEIRARYQSTEARRDMARSGQTRANAALTQARNSLGYTRIVAPFTGVLTEKKADVGTLVSPGVPIFTIEDTRSYRLEVSVDEGGILRVHTGQTVPVLIDSLGNSQISGKVAQIVPAADEASRTFLVKVELPSDSRLRSGLFGRAHFTRDDRAALLIPRTAVIERGQLQGVFVLDANQLAGLRYVTLGQAAGNNVEVLSGLQEGEKLVAAPGDREWGGKRIEPRP